MESAAAADGTRSRRKRPRARKRRRRLKVRRFGSCKAPRARPDRRMRAAERDVGGGIDPTHPASPSATAPHIQSYVPSSATAIRGAGPPGAPAAAKQDDPATDALNTIGAVEDMKDFANNKTGGNTGANDNTNHQRGGRVVRRR